MVTDTELIQAAREMLSKAYAPYSQFCVGAALLCARGSIFSGCNMENASFGAALCAERSAAAQALSAGRRDFLKIAVISSGEEICVPCGLCRQVLAEFSPDLEILCCRKDGSFSRFTLSELLPHAFTGNSLPSACISPTQPPSPAQISSPAREDKP